MMMLTAHQNDNIQPRQPLQPLTAVLCAVTFQREHVEKRKIGRHQHYETDVIRHSRTVEASLEPSGALPVRKSILRAGSRPTKRLQNDASSQKRGRRALHKSTFACFSWGSGYYWIRTWWCVFRLLSCTPVHPPTPATLYTRLFHHSIQVLGEHQDGA